MTWECSVCGANMGGMCEHIYPGEAEPSILCEECHEVATSRNEWESLPSYQEMDDKPVSQEFVDAIHRMESLAREYPIIIAWQTRIFGGEDGDSFHGYIGMKEMKDVWEWQEKIRSCEHARWDLESADYGFSSCTMWSSRATRWVGISASGWIPINIHGEDN
jgi:hypothetical protein